MSRITWTIGDLAAHTGLPVKTIRYYADIGLLPAAQRSAGGHRRYAPEALKRLQLVLRLPALDTPIATLTQLAAGERTLSELLTGELDPVPSRLGRTPLAPGHPAGPGQLLRSGAAAPPGGGGRRSPSPGNMATPEFVERPVEGVGPRD
ncbi:MerR family DNA-binding transcriptional regulator [Streptomyces sp. CA-135486]|uniref:helix-turn-helix domain-containing protein n=1 Tax=Streptomyces sp. CA-135486 TaxID=3240049 RepID=UPI003D89D7BA